MDKRWRADEQLTIDERLTVSSDVPLPIHVQVMEQIKWFVALGLLKPGDRLMSAAQLADRLQVNRNTIQAVYAQLREEGVLDTRKGFGTWVQDSEQTAQLVDGRAALGRFLKESFEEALEAGFDPARFAQASAAAFQLHAARQAIKPLLAASRGEEYGLLQERIARLIGGEPDVLLLEEDGADDVAEAAQRALAGRELVVASVAAASRLRALHPQAARAVVVVEQTIAASALLDIALSTQTARMSGNAGATNAVFVASGGAGAVWLERALDPLAGARQIVSADDRERVREALRDAQLVYAMPSVYAWVRDAFPGAVIKQLELELEKSGMFVLEQRLANI